ncbi:MAG TPA: chromate transporter [Chitinophagaceae bacterium]|nr:chromate transporter [Chitinophagaceae bacterium]
MSYQHFLDLAGATNLIPGPNSTEMTMHIGHERAGRKGLIVAGCCSFRKLNTAIHYWLSVAGLPAQPCIARCQPICIHSYRSVSLPVS